MKKTVFTLALLIGGLSLNMQAATWYLSAAGSDSNGCTAISPCKTINTAYQKAAAGDVIQMAGGSYGDQSLTSKSPASTIFVEPAAGATVSLTGLDVNGATRIELRKGSGASFSTGEFTVQMNSRYITLRDVDIKGYLGYLGGSDISVIGGSVGPLVDNHPQIAPVNGWQGQGVNFIFDGVRFHDMSRTNTSVHTECLQVAGTTNMVIRNSKFQNCAVFDLSFTEYNSSGKVTNLLLENNWFDTATSDGYFAVNLSQFSGGVSRFNSSEQGWVIQGTNPSPMTFIGNNIVSGVLSGNTGGCATSEVVYSYNVTQGQKCGSTDINAAPGFVNPGAFDLHLASGSAAIDFVPLTVAAPSADIEGLSRPFGLKLDAGASEFGAGGGTSSKPNPPTGLQVVVR
ncbi:MAG TPA: choice-of-anchor Q domain-containing protein [Terriglobales bacterium]|jgi:hypothetical protein|nr:choice-of-anchor Q domain-containing protein [Terriglobales bacterium]